MGRRRRKGGGDMESCGKKRIRWLFSQVQLQLSIQKNYSTLPPSTHVFHQLIISRLLLRVFFIFFALAPPLLSFLLSSFSPFYITRRMHAWRGEPTGEKDGWREGERRQEGTEVEEWASLSFCFFSLSSSCLPCLLSTKKISQHSEGMLKTNNSSNKQINNPKKTSTRSKVFCRVGEGKERMSNVWQRE